jgi:hypothetical protein
MHSWLFLIGIFLFATTICNNGKWQIHPSIPYPYPASLFFVFAICKRVHDTRTFNFIKGKSRLQFSEKIRDPWFYDCDNIKWSWRKTKSWMDASALLPLGCNNEPNVYSQLILRNLYHLAIVNRILLSGQLLVMEIHYISYQHVSSLRFQSFLTSNWFTKSSTYTIVTLFVLVPFNFFYNYAISFREYNLFSVD